MLDGRDASRSRRIGGRNQKMIRLGCGGLTGGWGREIATPPARPSQVGGGVSPGRGRGGGSERTHGSVRGGGRARRPRRSADAAPRPAGGVGFRRRGLFAGREPDRANRLAGAKKTHSQTFARFRRPAGRRPLVNGRSGATLGRFTSPLPPASRVPGPNPPDGPRRAPARPRTPRRRNGSAPRYAGGEPGAAGGRLHRPADGRGPRPRRRRRDARRPGERRRAGAARPARPGPLGGAPPGRFTPPGRLTSPGRPSRRRRRRRG